MDEGPAPAFRVRPGVEADLDDLMRLRADVAAEGVWIGAELPLDEAGDRSRLRPGRPGTATFVAVDDAGRLIANLGIELAPYGVAHLGMVVADGWRGRGVGRALLAVALDWAREAGAHKVELQLWPHNTAARRLYERMGFVEEGYLRRHYPRRSGELWDAVVMGLVLDEDRPGSSLH
ncbi:MAG: GNAT family N-acetyltransferase [Acidimicrobiales bacterium]|nr:GNAT family N-acetyltransferase [Acidimicrobiales bacterium]MCB1015105.1 GNAT family N-acetyltransferase [Acidimicrobiales bacterium]MCB9371328.1 GNAT family N-acetyltransferase [Microthrixaceae bacterium]